MQQVGEHRVERADAAAWAAFWAAVEAAGVWDWAPRYVDPGVLDGESWAVRLGHGGRAVESCGNNAWPDGWGQLADALEQLAGRPWR